MDGIGNTKMRATLIRLAPAGVQVLAMIPAGDGWRKELAEADIQPQDDWALVNAAQLLEKHPDPDRRTETPLS
jgi:hypothetical protein